MVIDILTVFPEMFAPLRESIIGRAVSRGLVEINVRNIRDYSKDKHRKTDDEPYGGGAGMVMTCQPICDAIDAIDPEHKALRVFMSPKGKTLRQKQAVEMARGVPWLIILCGHYEGVDERAISLCIDEQISLGDFVLTGGELPAMCLTDCICRYLDGILGSGDSLLFESFSQEEQPLLEYPQFTRPEVFRGLRVPEVLLSGNHGEIKKYRDSAALEETRRHRPDMLKNDGKVD